VMEGWMLDPRTPTETAKSFDAAVDDLRDLARDLGPAWKPPLQQGKPSLLGFIGQTLSGDAPIDESRAARRKEDEGHWAALNLDADEVYQFTCSGAFGSTIIVRIIHGHGQTICVCYASHGFDPVIMDAKIISEEAWTQVKERLAEVDFWHLPEWSPRDGPVFDLGTLFVELAGVELPHDQP
jgi:hypothetical protein